VGDTPQWKTSHCESTGLSNGSAKAYTSPRHSPRFSAAGEHNEAFHGELGLTAGDLEMLRGLQVV
jgi:hypothetical protein